MLVFKNFLLADKAFYPDIELEVYEQVVDNVYII